MSGGSLIKKLWSDISYFEEGERKHESENNKIVRMSVILAERCVRCLTRMEKFHSCELICKNCGARLDCSDL